MMATWEKMVAECIRWIVWMLAKRVRHILDGGQGVEVDNIVVCRMAKVDSVWWPSV